jgi:hypothetical protein
MFSGGTLPRKINPFTIASAIVPGPMIVIIRSSSMDNTSILVVLGSVEASSGYGRAK